jgi:membrane associated rhomboid family serine protease
MGLYDRDYTQEGYQQQFRNSPQMRMSFPQLTPAVKWLLIINVVVYFVQILGGDSLLQKWFSVYPASLWLTLQLWRLVTYQFLHGGLWHILFNMLGLFFLGPTLERHWGSRKFLIFYLGCGAVGGVVYPILLALRIISPHQVLGVLPLIGASGAILGMLAACAIMFPHFVVFIIFFPVPIRVAAIICIFIAVAVILGRGANAGGEAAHLGGMAAGAIYVFSQSWRNKFGLKIRTGRWEKKMAAQHRLQVELDLILKKVHDSGLHSLTHREKRILKKATKAQQMRNEL